MDYPGDELVNRRKFLFGALIAPVGAIAAAKIPDLGSNIPKRPKITLYVVATQRQAQALYNELGEPENAKVISAGSAICGYGADLIVMDENWRSQEYGSRVRKQHFDDWFNDTIRTRLYPGGRIITRLLVKPEPKEIWADEVWPEITRETKKLWGTSICETRAHRMHQEALSKWLAEKVDNEVFKLFKGDFNGQKS